MSKSKSEFRRPSGQTVRAVIAGATLTALVGMAALAGSTAQASPATAAMALPAAAMADRRDAVHLTAYANGDGSSETVVLTGAIGDYGQAVFVYPDGSVDPDHDSELSLQLSRGTLRLDIAPLDKAFVAAVVHDFPTNAATCSGSASVTRKAAVVAGSGTGAYRNVTGSFTLTATLDEVDAAGTSAPCDGTGAILGQVIVITGPGVVAF
ncbi:hypothetical protein KDL01_30550 [Actinospica durhamensis]|uniref:Uncharacterized protein n=1 Tax=Actinospica durhamensis TaxID=1508375 RepID=A0A941IQH4_9ACTN|nr:hypothetical protein [Actinospica durhamensis]MBR7837660.1 hypothetical protein [Actinospica durhamensis]